MKLSFEFAGGERLTADVLAERVTQTSQCVAAAVPISATVFQARWSGREIFVPIALPKKPPRENQSIRAGKRRRHLFLWEQSYDFTGFEAVGLFYEFVREWRGDCPVNVFARISPDQFGMLEVVGERIWRKGGEAIKIDVIT